MPNYPEKATLPFILAILQASEEELRAHGLEALVLVDIYNDYLTRQAELSDIAAFITQTLTKAEGVHSVKYRVKDPLHLLHKIIRKKEEYPNRSFDQHSYLDLINDLIGVRVLHLYKESWISTGEYIQGMWELKREPYAYVRHGENEQNIQHFTEHGCKVMGHPSGYKAIHFVIETRPNKQRYYAEIQLRTLFEESWSEIDHNIRYPDHTSDEFIDHLLQLLNKFTSCADEMATHIRALATKLKYKADEKEIRAHIDQLPVSGEDKQLLHAQVSKHTGGE
ncbi:MAG: RelA/SpoT domain-containing protein [Hymenobacteraceae bacterium]|nr:RelA/SpoT domain-containing protein [Hymenobacteraceae bacterium]